ncbi:MAG: peptide ABC transporter substrate-binding protein [Cellulosilyticaceae bacterium]
MAKCLKKLLIMGIALLTLVGCKPTQEKVVTTSPVPTQKPSQDEKTTQSNSIRIAMRNPITLHPIYNTEKSVEQALHLVFNTLVNIEEDGSISPNIATSWTMDKERNILTLELKNDIKWHDNTTLTAEDVVFTIDTIRNAPESPYKTAISNLVSAEAVDSDTVNLTYKQPFSGVLQTLFFPVIPKHIYNVDSAAALKLMPVGNGPYKFKSNTQLKNVVLEANKDYFKGVPHISEVEITITPDEESSLYSFEQGLIDVVYTDVMDWGKYAKDKSATIYEIHTNCYEYMGLNFNKPQFQNKNIREALVYGLDRSEIIDVYYLGHGLVTDTPISPASYLHDKTLEQREYDKEKAKFLLVQEGYQKEDKSKLFTKNGIPLEFNLLVNKENKERVKVAGEIQKMYKEIGVQVNVEQVDEPTYLSRVYANQFDAFLGGWKLSYTPDLSFAFHSAKIQGGENFIHYKDAQMDTLLGAAFVAPQATMVQAYAKLQSYFKEQNPYVSLYFRNGALITKKKIKGTIKPQPMNIYANIEQWEIK